MADRDRFVRQGLSVQRSRRLRRGVYETDYGNAAVVYSNRSRRAYDLDMGEWIPLEMVTDRFLRDVEPSDAR